MHKFFSDLVSFLFMVTLERNQIHDSTTERRLHAGSRKWWMVLGLHRKLYQKRMHFVWPDPSSFMFPNTCCLLLFFLVRNICTPISVIRILIPCRSTTKQVHFQHGRCEVAAIRRTVAEAEKLPGSCRNNLHIPLSPSGSLLTVYRPSSEREKSRATGPRNKHFGIDTWLSCCWISSANRKNILFSQLSSLLRIYLAQKLWTSSRR